MPDYICECGGVIYRRGDLLICSQCDRQWGKVSVDLSSVEFTTVELERLDEAEIMRRQYMLGQYELEWIAAEDLQAGDRVTLNDQGKLRRARASDPVDKTFVMRSAVPAGEIYSYKSLMRPIVVGVDPGRGPDETVVVGGTVRKGRLQVNYSAVVGRLSYQVLQEDDGEIDSYIREAGR